MNKEFLALRFPLDYLRINLSENRVCLLEEIRDNSLFVFFFLQYVGFEVSDLYVVLFRELE